jgi:23S rRNA pseudouridine955/2504/2580 synthase
MPVSYQTVGQDDDGQRFDRWFKKLFPAIGYGVLQKLLRTGQIRVDGKRATASTRLIAGQQVRIPPFPEGKTGEGRSKKDAQVSPADAKLIRSMVIHQDKSVIVLNKPPGLAVQGGSGTHRHVDGMLGALSNEEGVKPRLVHRIDKDTSGILLLARSSEAARFLTDQFRRDRVIKTYWALVKGVPDIRKGVINMPLGKDGAKGGEKVVADYDEGKDAVTEYAVVDNAGRKVSWLAMRPRTGRTHQLRVHAAEGLNRPIIGDGKYGGPESFITGLSNKLHLHARRIEVRLPGGGHLDVSAELPEHMAASWSMFEFDGADADNPFDED